MKNTYSPAQVARLSPIIREWQLNRTPFPAAYQREVATFFTAVCMDRWNAHFCNIKTQWVHTSNVQESVMEAWIDYLLWPKPCVVQGKYRSCLLKADYHRLEYTLFAFKVQFPRVITTLQLRDVGLCPFMKFEKDNTVRNTWLTRSICGRTQTNRYNQVHHATVAVRKLLQDYSSYEEMYPVLYSRLWKSNNVSEEQAAVRDWILYCGYALHLDRSTVKYDGITNDSTIRFRP